MDEEESAKNIPPEAWSPDHIMVVFRNDITEAELDAAGIEIDNPIPARRNPLLRVDAACELLADAIASKLGLGIGSQVFTGRTRMAEFRVPAGLDRDAVLAELSEKYGAFIVSATPSQLAIPAFDPNDTDYQNSGRFGGPQWYLHAMDFEIAWDQTLGSDELIIAVLDSGCNMQHEELSGQVVNPAMQWPEIEADIANGDASIEDVHGHGTAVCGLLAAATDNGRTLAGAAPGCSVVPLKMTNDWVDFTLGRYIEGGYLAQLIGADILVQSFTIFEANPAVHDMLQDLSEDGMLLIAAAGNDGDANDNWPGAWPEVLAVGSTEVDDSRSSFSNHASSVELAAPGRDIRICGHQFDSGALAYLTEEGTSLSAPLVAAAAGLLWSAQPELDAARIRELLALTGRQSTGFEHSVSVVDAGALFDSQQPVLQLPQLPGMIHSGDLAISAGVLAEPDSASLLLGADLLQSLQAAPWQFSAQSDSQLFSPALLAIESSIGEQTGRDEALLLIDNTPGIYPLHDDAETDNGMLVYFDAALAQQQVRLSLENQFMPDWTEQSVLQFGRGSWQRIDSEAAAGQWSWYCGRLAEQDYDRQEFDCLVSRRIDLAEAVEPVLRFSQKFNVQDGGFGYDRLSILLSSDNGASWQLLAGDGHPGWFSGYQADWQAVEIPLADYIGMQVHLCFSLQSDGLLEGEQAGAAEGWWIDSIAIEEADNSTQADFSLAGGLEEQVFGEVSCQLSIPVQLENVVNATGFSYSLDCKPFGIDLGEDILHESTGLTGVNLNINSLQRPNQRAWLTVSAIKASGETGRTVSIPLWLFNQPGDANADGLVNELDRQLLADSLLLMQGEPGWLPYMDSDLDGVISERDMAAVAYFWSAGS